MNSIYIGILCLLLAVLPAKADMDNLIASIRSCHESNPIAAGEFEKFTKDKNAEFGDDFKCHVKCVLEKENAFKNGKFDDQAFVKFSLELPEWKNRQNDLQKAADECKNEKGANECDLAYNVAKCLVDRNVIVVVANKM
ncbi:general odorant-binding protein 56h-like [Musca vetustissima]|uniref:general odorant-binding protein 56h-like n=1 Tax=Musca vetustissima TaxID=27455 RepID=UPI002AB6B65C|nr:general odorant-binding protein 56h-like [Musca vetustissima]